MEQIVIEAREALRRTGCSRSVFAKLVELREPQLSRLLTGMDSPPPRRREKFAMAVAFIVMVSESPLPICLHRFEPLRPLWETFKKQFGTHRATQPSEEVERVAVN